MNNHKKPVITMDMEEYAKRSIVEKKPKAETIEKLSDIILYYKDIGDQKARQNLVRRNEVEKNLFGFAFVDERSNCVLHAIPPSYAGRRSQSFHSGPTAFVS